jgi:excisionase family DNA binding protein
MTTTELTTEQLASVLGVHRTTITRMVLRGELHPVAGKGRGYRFDPDTMRDATANFIRHFGDEQHDHQWTDADPELFTNGLVRCVRCNLTTPQRESGAASSGGD